MNLYIKKSKSICAILIFLCSLSNTLFAATENTQAWGELNLTGSFLNIPKLEYAFQAQGRYNFDPNTFIIGYALGGLGYDYTPTVSFWAGYQWNSINYFSDTAQENYLWQQVNWKLLDSKILTFTTLSRVEERERVNEEQWAYRLRQRFIVKAPQMLVKIYTPVFWEELYFNLNKPSWVSAHTFSQNRAFIGVDFPTTDNSYMEVGYLNQIQYNPTENQVNNAFYFSLNINTG